MNLETLKGLHPEAAADQARLDGIQREITAILKRESLGGCFVIIAKSGAGVSHDIYPEWTGLRVLPNRADGDDRDAVDDESFLEILTGPENARATAMFAKAMQLILRTMYGRYKNVWGAINAASGGVWGKAINASEVDP
jgi:hypothetical protein